MPMERFEKEVKKTVASSPAKVFAIIMLLSTAIDAESQTLVNEHITQPDLWRPAMETTSRVDAKGDLNLSIPVMTIPGRNGLDFDIVFRYRSGISAKQTSSWIGTGWSFDPGSITRDVRSMLQDGIGYNVDFTDVAEVQPDLYYVTSPAGAFTLVRHNTGVGSTTGAPPSGSVNDFFRTDWRPWKIEYETGYLDFGSMNHVDCICTQVIAPGSGGTIAKDDIISWTLTDEGGRRYVFAHPTLDSFVGVYSNQNLHAMEYFVGAWRLIAILGRDYDGEIPIQPADLTASSPGSWIKFEYSDPNAVSYTDVDLTGFGAVKQASYLTAIETPTHRAEFLSIPKTTVEIWPDQWEGGLNSIYKQLSSIQLYTLAGSHPELIIKEVTVEQSAGISGYTGTERLSLDAIAYYGVDGSSGVAELPGYRFSYYGTTTGTLNDYTDDLDDFGYYNAEDYSYINTDSSDAASWSLRTIVHPVGFLEEFIYSNDEICNYCGEGLLDDYLYPIPYREYTYFPDGLTFTDKNMSISSSRTRQGGARVIAVNRYESESTSLYSTTRYQYQGGRVSGVPSAFLERQYPSVFFKNVNRGQSAVYYNRVRKINPDETWTETYYSTDLSHPGVTVPIKTVVFQKDSDRLVITGNEDITWGRPYRVVSSEGASIETDITEDQSLFRLAEVANLSGNELSVWWRRSGWTLSKSKKRYVTGDLNVGGYISSVTDIEYDPVTSQPRVVLETSTGINSRRTEFTYLTDIPEYSWAADRNILNEPAKVDFAETSGDAESLSYYKSVARRWAIQEVNHQEVELAIPYPATTYSWSSAEFSESVPEFSSWSVSDEVNEDWIGDDTVLEVDAFGNPHVVQDINGSTTVLNYSANSSRLSTILGKVSESDILAESFAGSDWEDKWSVNASGNDDIFRVGSEALIVQTPPGGLNSVQPFVSHELLNGIDDRMTLEFDVTVSSSDSRALFISVGNADYAALPNHVGTAIWTAFEDDKWFVFDRNKWRASDLTVQPGRTYRILIESDVETGESVFRADGNEVYATSGFIGEVDLIEAIAIGLHDGAQPGSIWKVDNVRLYDSRDLVARIDYDPLFLRPSTVVDERGVTTKYVYDHNGRLRGKNGPDDRRNERTTYSMSRTDNTAAFDVTDPSSVSTRIFPDAADITSLFSESSWITNGLNEFGVIDHDRFGATVGGNPSMWSWIRTPDLDTVETAELDVWIDEAVTGVPHIVSFVGPGQQFSIRYNGNTKRFCISYSNASNGWTWDCWSAFDVAQSRWYTARIVNKNNGYFEAYISHADHPSHNGGLKSVGGFDAAGMQYARTMAKEDEIMVADYYVGSMTETKTYFDAFGRTIQEETGDASLTKAVATTYDVMGRVRKTYLPVPSSGFIDNPDAAVGDYYAEAYPGQTVWPYAEKTYDEFGRLEHQYAPQSRSERVRQTTSYHGEPFFTSLNPVPAHMVDIITTTTANDNVISVIKDALDRPIVERRAVSRPADESFPASVALRVDRENSPIQPSPDSTGIFPSEVDLNNWANDSFTYSPDRTFMVRFDIALDVDATGDAYVVMKQNESTIKKWVFDNSQVPTQYSGYASLLEGQTYDFEVAAGVSTDDSYPGASSSELQLTFSEDGKYRGLSETQFGYDANDNATVVISPECFANASVCPPVGGTWRTSMSYDTMSRMIARSASTADGDADNDPTNEWGSVEADFRYKYTPAGLLRFEEDPVSRNHATSKFLITDYDMYGRPIESGVYRGKHSFDYASPAKPLSGIVTGVSSSSYRGGQLREVNYDSTSYTYGYDSSGNITELTVALPGLSGKVIRYVYDRIGNPIRTEFEPASDDSFITWYRYDGFGRLKGVGSSDITDPSAAINEVSYEYDIAGRPLQVMIGHDSAQVINYTYDIAGRLTRMNDINDPSTGVFAESIGYDVAGEIALSESQVVPYTPRYDGNISWLAWRTDGNDDGGAIGGYTYAYDDLNRLQRADYGKRFSVTSGWSSSSRYDLNAGSDQAPVAYDANGNFLGLERSSETGVSTATEFSYETVGSDQVTNVAGGVSRAMAYDANGNLVSDGATLSGVAYDHNDLPVEIVTPAGVIGYRYDANQNRISKSGLSVTFYVRGVGGEILAVYGPDGNLEKWNIIAGGNTIGYAVP